MSLFETQTILGVRVLSMADCVGLEAFQRSSPRRPSAWQKPPAAGWTGLQIATAWAHSGGAALLDDLQILTWPYYFVGASPNPRALLVRGTRPWDFGAGGPSTGWSFNDDGAPPAELAALDLAGPPGDPRWGEFYKLCNAEEAARVGAAPWALWLSSPNFWPLWVQSEVARLGHASAPSSAPAMPRAPGVGRRAAPSLARPAVSRADRVGGVRGSSGRW